jgi:uncharacterized protein (TIGR00730 family)
VPVRSVCVYCASSPGFDPAYGDLARELGTRLVAEDLRLVYGGGAVGLMGILADEVLARGGEVVGVIPRGLFAREIAHHGLTELHEVESMHERKALMFELAEAFVALPGGLGTLEELAEITTWAQLGLHRAPIVLLDVKNFWSPLLALLDGAVAEGFLHPDNRALLTRVDTLDDLLTELGRPRPVPAQKWLDASET